MGTNTSKPNAVESVCPYLSSKLATLDFSLREIVRPPDNSLILSISLWMDALAGNEYEINMRNGVENQSKHSDHSPSLLPVDKLSKLCE